MDILPINNQNFYEIAWKARDALIDRWCSEKGTNALRVLKKLELHEAQFRLGVRTGTIDQTGEKILTGGYDWEPRPVDPGGLPTGVPAYLTVALRDRDITVPFYADLAGIPARWVAHHCETHTYDAIVELGSGAGRNIFSIYYHGGPPGPYFACEFAESGRRITERLAALEPTMAITVVPFDHRVPDFSFLAGYKKILLLSVHSIEQVKTLPADYFDRLAGAAESVTAMHFEPFGFQLGGNNPVANRQRKWFVDHGWNLDLLERLRDADQRGVIHMSFLSENLFSNTQENPTSVAIWEAKRGAAP